MKRVTLHCTIVENFPNIQFIEVSYLDLFPLGSLRKHFKLKLVCDEKFRQPGWFTLVQSKLVKISKRELSGASFRCRTGLVIALFNDMRTVQFKAHLRKQL